MKENLRPIPEEVSRQSDPMRSQRGEIKVGEAGFWGFLAGLYILSDGANKNSEPEMIVGGVIALGIMFEAIASSLITSIRNSKTK